MAIYRQVYSKLLLAICTNFTQYVKRNRIMQYLLMGMVLGFILRGENTKLSINGTINRCFAILLWLIENVLSFACKLDFIRHYFLLKRLKELQNSDNFIYTKEINASDNVEYIPPKYKFLWNTNFCSTYSIDQTAIRIFKYTPKDILQLKKEKKIGFGLCEVDTKNNFGTLKIINNEHIMEELLDNLVKTNKTWIGNSVMEKHHVLIFRGLLPLGETYIWIIKFLFYVFSIIVTFLIYEFVLKQLFVNIFSVIMGFN